jgi:hypothetical protein
MRQPVCTRLDRVARLRLGSDVHYRELAVSVRRSDETSEGSAVQHRSWGAEPCEVVVDDLDVVRAFGDARAHERVGFGRVGDGREWRSAHL